MLSFLFSMSGRKYIGNLKRGGRTSKVSVKKHRLHSGPVYGQLKLPSVTMFCKTTRGKGRIRKEKTKSDQEHSATSVPHFKHKFVHRASDRRGLLGVSHVSYSTSYSTRNDKYWSGFGDGNSVSSELRNSNINSNLQREQQKSNSHRKHQSFNRNVTSRASLSRRIDHAKFNSALRNESSHKFYKFVDLNPITKKAGNETDFIGFSNEISNVSGNLKHVRESLDPTMRKDHLRSRECAKTNATNLRVCDSEFTAHPAKTEVFKSNEGGFRRPVTPEDHSQCKNKSSEFKNFGFSLEEDTVITIFSDSENSKFHENISGCAVQGGEVANLVESFDVLSADSPLSNIAAANRQDSFRPEMVSELEISGTSGDNSNSLFEGSGKQDTFNSKLGDTPKASEFSVSTKFVSFTDSNQHKSVKITGHERANFEKMVSRDVNIALPTENAESNELRDFIYVRNLKNRRPIADSPYCHEMFESRKSVFSLESENAELYDQRYYDYIFSNNSLGLLNDSRNRNLHKLISSFNPPYEIQMALNSLRKYVESVVKRREPHINVYITGSVATGFWTNESDCDFTCLVDPDANVSCMSSRGKTLAVLHHLKSYLRVREITNVSMIHARVPILKFFHRPTKMMCDISAGNLVPIANTELLKIYTRIDPRYRELNCLVKYFARKANAIGGQKSLLSSYSYSLLILHFMQYVTEPPILPNLSVIDPELMKPESIMSAMEKINFDDYSSTNKQPIAELYDKFINYYGSFNWKDHKIDIETGLILNKNCKDNPNHFINIIEPYSKMNTASTVGTIASFLRVIKFFRSTS